MKKYVGIIICMFVFLPIFVMADKTFNDGKELANNYIYSLPEYSRYLKTNGNQPFGFDGTKVTQVDGFSTGGFLSTKEYERSKNGNSSYLAPGIEYWLINRQRLNIKSEPINNDSNMMSGVRVTEYVLHGARVKGAGTQTTPWEFIDGYTVKIGTTDRTKGTISESYEHVYPNSETAYDFSLKLTGKYNVNIEECLKNKNGKFEKVSENGNEIKYKVTKVISDFICNIDLGASCNKVKFTNNGKGTGGMDGKSLYYKYGSGWYNDEKCSSSVPPSSITKPTRSGYIFLGYKTTDKIIIDKDLKLYSKYNDESITNNLTATAEWDGYFTTYITELYNSGLDGLTKDSHNNIRYNGKNPNNYVTFNGEQWRVVGVFVDSGEPKVKLVRENNIGSFVFDSSARGVNNGYGINQWGPTETYTGADLYILLNDTYYLSKIGTCYVGRDNKTKSCDFRSTGIKSETRNLIANTTWNAGATNIYFNNVTSIPNASQFYDGEHSNNSGKNCSGGDDCNDGVTRNAKASGYVGLIGASDYKYAGGKNSYLYHDESMWLLSIYCHEGSGRAMYSVYTSNVQNDSSKVGNVNCTGESQNVYPAVYLKEDTIRVSGNGKSSNPYIISR